MALLIIRAFGERGRYPMFRLETPTHLYVPSSDGVYGAVLEPAASGLHEFPEVAWYSPQEIRLYAAVTLVGERMEHEGWVVFEPWSVGHPIEVPNDTNLLAADSRDLIASELATLVDVTARHAGTRRVSDVPYELVAIGDPYRCQRLVHAIDPTDDLCLRGLSKLITAAALTRHFAFMEEAALSAYISLEAALSLLRRQIGDGEGDATSYDDAFEYLRARFPTGSRLVAFMKDLYEVRTMIVHPTTKHGTHWSPPMFADDCYEAIEWLVVFYRYLLLGELPEEAAALASPEGV